MGVLTCNKSQDSFIELQKAINVVKGEVEQIVELMTDLGKKSRLTTLATEIIQELAEQTTILSYNAEIEAAAAGEAGAGFSVVAAQVGELAERAKESLQNVYALVNEIQSASDKTLNATNKALRATQSSLQVQKNAEESLLLVTKQIEKSSVSIKNIEAGSQQQYVATDNLLGNIEKVFDSAEKSKDSSKQIIETAESIFESAENLKTI